MFFIIAGGVIGFFIGLISVFKNHCKRIGEIVGEFVCGVFMCAFVGFLLTVVFSNILPTKYQTIKEVELTSLRNGGMSTSGTLFLGCGSVESKPCYFYYTAVGENIYQMESVEITDRTFVYEENRANGVFEIHSRVPAAPFPFNCLMLKPFICGSDRYEFHIPRGSIAQTFSL
ncbi:MAG: hypothetical protein WC242_00890 [Candidatus Paceibacterota bacterium]|jgi:hypothetical protein